MLYDVCGRSCVSRFIETEFPGSKPEWVHVSNVMMRDIAFTPLWECSTWNVTFFIWPRKKNRKRKLLNRQHMSFDVVIEFAVLKLSNNKKYQYFIMSASLDGGIFCLLSGLNNNQRSEILEVFFIIIEAQICFNNHGYQYYLLYYCKAVCHCFA